MKTTILLLAATAATFATPARAVVHHYAGVIALDPAFINAAGNYVAELPGANITLNPGDEVVGTIRFANKGRLTITDDKKLQNEQDVSGVFGGGLSSFYWTITGVEGEYLRPAYQEGSCSVLCFTTFGDLTNSSFSFTGADFRFLYRGEGPVTFDPGHFYAGKVRVDAVPEPATWAMMIGGLGLAGATMRRRTRTVIAFA